MKMRDISYMDHASATPVLPEVKEAIMPFFDTEYFNPSVVYNLGMRVKAGLDWARGRVADLIGAQAEEIIFTSSGAEANNLAVKGIAFANPKKGKRIIVSAIEHHSVLNAARFFERLDYEVTFLPVDSHGLVDPERLRSVISPDTVLVSIMHGNNEIGTIQPIEELCEIAHENGAFSHTDAVATVGNVAVDVKELGVDLLSLSGVSIGAPKGVGALYFKRNTRLMPLVHGGIQESGRRAGTENVPGIIGLGKAAELRKNHLKTRAQYLSSLRDRLVQGITSAIPKVHFTGHPEKRLPNHASFCIEGIEGEALIFMLAANSIYANTGSACASKALKTSSVLVAIGLSDVVAQGSVVFTLEESNTQEDVHKVLEVLPQVTERLRAMSPLWKEAA